MDGGEGRGWEVRLDGGERDWVRIIERVEVKRQKKRGPVDWFVRLRVVWIYVDFWDCLLWERME